MFAQQSADLGSPVFVGRPDILHLILQKYLAHVFRMRVECEAPVLQVQPDSTCWLRNVRILEWASFLATDSPHKLRHVFSR